MRSDGHSQEHKGREEQLLSVSTMPWGANGSSGTQKHRTLQARRCHGHIRDDNGANWLTCASQVDIDCAEKNGFNETDKKYLEELAALLGRACDW